MRFKSEIWTIKDLIDKESVINPKPQYQRTPVWSYRKKVLLIDSILRNYDLPKIYIKKTEKDPLYNYEVIDGQQRMRTIWEFTSNKFSIDSEEVKNSEYKGYKFQKLPSDVKRRFIDYKIVISVVIDSTPEEIRTLFARLQMGMTLLPVELRHALASNLGTTLFSITENNPFFLNNNGISNNRFKYQDYLDHAMALIYYNNDKDLKAPTLYQLYIDLSDATHVIIKGYIYKINRILRWLDDINGYSKGIFKNKWGFIDNFWFLYQLFDRIDKINSVNYAESFYNFENKRKRYNLEPEKLIEDKASSNYDKDLYDYIEAFNRQGGLKKNISIRHRVINNKLNNKSNIILK